MGTSRPKVSIVSKDLTLISFEGENARKLAALYQAVSGVEIFTHVNEALASETEASIPASRLTRRQLKMIEALNS